VPTKSLLDSPKYKKFVQDRDSALEKVHQNTGMDLSRILFEGLDQIKNLTASLALRSKGEFHMVPALSQEFESGTLRIMSELFPMIVGRIQSMRKAIFTLTYLSELEAIGRATGRKPEVSRSDFKGAIWDATLSKTLLDEDLTKRVWYSMMRLRSRLNQALSLALVQELNPEEIVERIVDQFPKVQNFTRPPRKLKPLRESDQDSQQKKEFIDTFFVDDGDWELAVDAYKSTQLPSTRFDNFAQLDPESSYFRYSWEIEQEMTEDFVNQVRSGQVKAATDLGVKDFVWIAILDDRTDDCCRERHGLTMSEIKRGMADGSIDSDSCDALTPPAHFNCRCQIGPVASVDEVEGPDWKDFNEWLES